MQSDRICFYPKKQIYYIGDSKYYKQKNEIGSESVAKQYTYARNVIQWHIGLFGDEESSSHVQLRDPMTEGYNVIPNFFISGTIPLDFAYTDNISEADKKAVTRSTEQFPNRLFDRDTLLITHYDVNFLYILTLYGRNNAIQKKGWKEKVRNIFRRKIQDILNARYKFRAIQPKPGVDAEAFFKDHFKEVIGKVYQPFEQKNIFTLALCKEDEYAAENDKVLNLIESHFDTAIYELGENPIEDLPPYIPSATLYPDIQKRGIMMVMMELYDNRAPKFSETGKLAVPIHYTEDGMELLSNAANVGSVLFHVRRREGQHMFQLRSSITFVPREQIDTAQYYLAVNHPTPRGDDKNIVFLYALLDIDMEHELDSARINNLKKPFANKQERYDAQFATIDLLTNTE